MLFKKLNSRQCCSIQIIRCELQISSGSKQSKPAHSVQYTVCRNWESCHNMRRIRNSNALTIRFEVTASIHTSVHAVHSAQSNCATIGTSPHIGEKFGAIHIPLCQQHISVMPMFAMYTTPKFTLCCCRRNERVTLGLVCRHLRASPSYDTSSFRQFVGGIARPELRWQPLNTRAMRRIWHTTGHIPTHKKQRHKMVRMLTQEQCKNKPNLTHMIIT